MNNELTTYQPQSVEILTVDPTGGRLVAWAEGLAAAHRIGTALCQTSFVPQHFRGKPEEAAAAILYGDEIGFTPTQAVQNLYVIGGKPALYARSMVALVLSKGHEVWTVEKSDQKVVVAGRRKGSPHTVEETWTPARAQKAGYTNNKKYVSDPQAMLYARAAADVCRQIAPDALAGLSYTAEEMELEQPAPAVKVSRAKAAKPVTPEPEFEATPVKAEPVADATPEPEFDEPTPEPGITDKTRRKMFALFGAKGISEDQQLSGINHITGKGYTSRGDLTEADALAVIDVLNQRPDAQPEQGDLLGGSDD